MSLGRLKFAGIIFGVSCAAGVAGAGTLNQEDEPKNALEILHKIQSSAEKLNYAGTFVYQQANQIRTSRITHYADVNGELEKLEILDGKPREYIRKGDEVSCFLPETKTIQIEKNVTQEVFPALLTQNMQSLPDLYWIKKGELNRVAGVECQTYLLEPRDAYRYGYRLCSEKNSGLLLRAQTVNTKNEVIEQIAFTQLKLGEIDKNKLKPSFQNVAQWHIENLTVQSNISSGWIVKSLPAGFKKIRELKRVIPTPSGSGKQSASHQVIQMIFSDGLAAFSVFIEPDNEARTEGSLQQGALTIMGRRRGSYWLTVVGEVPVPTIQQIMNSIELKSK